MVREQQGDTSWYGGTGEIMTSRQCTAAATRRQDRESSRPPLPDDLRQAFETINRGS
jgi:hypothetical protein